MDVPETTARDVKRALYDGLEPEHPPRLAFTRFYNLYIVASERQVLPKFIFVIQI